MAKLQNPEYSYQVALFRVRSLSNLHPGSASENYGIIDRLVQRDAATGFPCINSSSLKGALREFCANYLRDPEDDIVNYIFGLDKREGEQNNDQSNGPEGKQIAGAYRFLPADLLSMPVRSEEIPYFNATCPWLMQNLQHQLKLFGKKLPNDWLSGLSAVLQEESAVCFGKSEAAIDLEDIHLTPKSPPFHHAEAQKCLGRQIAVLSDELFSELVSDYRLPVIARNNLEDGRSVNLWYEQVLPRESALAFLLLYPDGNDNHFAEFRQAITSHPVQIGANASIGYGFCEITEIELADL